LLYVDPPIISPPDYNYVAGDIFAVNIMISGVADLKSWQFEISFHGVFEEVLRVAEVIEGDFLMMGGETYFTYNIDNSAGSVLVADIIIGPVPGVYGDGWLATVVFEVVGGGESPLDLNNTQLFDSNSVAITHDAVDGSYVGAAPHATFRFRPSVPEDGYAPAVNQTITFNATSSYDPSGGTIVSYEWDFDVSDTSDATVTTSDPIIQHAYTGGREAAHNYGVNLTVTDNDGHRDSFINYDMYIVIRDIAVTRLVAEPSGQVKAGTPIFINVTVENIGTSVETFSVTTYYDNVPINTTYIWALNPIPDPFVPPFYYIKSFLVEWDTTGLPADDYTIRTVATTFPNDFNMTNNEYVWGDIMISSSSRLLYDVDVYGKAFKVAIETDSDVSGFMFDYAGKLVSFNVSGPAEAFSYANVTVPMTLLNVSSPASWIVMLNAVASDFTATSNGTHYFVYLDYTFSSLYTIRIIGSKVPIPPQPVLQMSTNVASIGEPVTFDGSLSSDPDGHGIKEYFWWVYRYDPFPNKNNIWNATTTMPAVTVTFNLSAYGPNALCVTLTVTNSFGLKNSTEEQHLEVVDPVPKAFFTFGPSPSTVGENVTFYATASYDEDGEIVSYTWDFGDGTNSSETAPVTIHTYWSSGTYTVSLTVTDDDGLNATTSMPVEVLSEPPPPPVGPIIYVYPPVIETYPASNFTININIANATNVYAWEVTLSWDAYLLDFVSATEGDFLKGPEENPTLFVTPVVFEDEVDRDRVIIACTRLGGGIGGVNGEGILAAVTFRVEDAGETTLDLYDTKLRDPVPDVISHTSADGYVKSTTTTPTMPIIYVHPSMIETFAPQMFTVNVNIANATDIYAWEVKLSWDAYLLDFVSAAEGNFLKGIEDSPTYFVTQIFEDEIGRDYIQIACTRLGGDVLGVNGAGTLAAVKFRVEDAGETTLALYDTKLRDSDIDPIFHSSSGGYVRSTMVTPVRDIAITYVDAYPTEVMPGRVVWIDVRIENQGTANETFDVVAYYDDHVIGAMRVWSLPRGTSLWLEFGWDTSGVAEGTYTIRLEVDVLPGEIDTADNTYVDGTVTVTVPKITIDPSSGPVGTKVTVSGHGLPTYAGLYLTFDDQLMGIIYTSETGELTAVFNVPLSEVGQHVVKVTIGYYPYPWILEAPFTVINVAPLDVTVDVGTIHFKGDTAEFHIQTVLEGAAVDATSLIAQLLKPDGTTQALTPSRIGTGLYSVEYVIKGKGSMTGTYTLLVEANYDTDTVSASGTNIKTFLVKPTWERELPKIAALSITSIGLVVGMLVLWKREKKRYL
jgi:PKD repeat protein